ncbi:MAG: carboxymuconolactone decarboxylase family protein [Clostridiales Family XIII bacterium]|jgi:4-carboxymuconolactone decarboxylase|nr:carboxymuconolactone decarboxylase family protein [Clostridiales Family XIII bacterium]
MEKKLRTPYLKPSEMNAEQRAFYEDVLANMGRPDLPHVWKLDEGQIVGPFTSMLAFPQLGEMLYHLQRRIVCQSPIPADVAELFILAVASKERCAYAIYAHELLARKAGVPAETVSAVAADPAPADLSFGKADETAAYAFAKALTAGGPVPGAAFERAIAVFGETGVNFLVHTAGLFKYLCTLMNAYDEPIPLQDEGGTE